MGLKIEKIFLESIETKKRILKKLIPEIKKTVEIIISALKKGKKILICGNGGSAADAQHFVGELICTFENKNRKSLPAISLNSNTSIITAYANDFSFESIFERQIEGLGEEGDVLIGITTSGNSKNILKAFKLAKMKKMKTICFGGKGGGDSKDIGLTSTIIIPSENTGRIQEAHITLIHAICYCVDDAFKGNI